MRTVTSNEAKKNCSIIPILTMAVCSCMFVLSCQKDDEPTLSLSENQIDFPASGGESSFTIDSNASWVINGVKNWCYLAVTQGKGKKEITVEVEKNGTQEERICRLTVSVDDELTETVLVRQDAAETTLAVSPSDITFDGDKGLKDEFTITTTGHWTITGIPEWLNVPSSGDGDTKCKIETASENDTDEERTAELQISAGDKNVILNVTQKGLRVKCYIRPTNLVALYDQICFDLRATGDINTFKYIVHSEYDAYERLTVKEIEEELEQLEPNKFADDYILFPSTYYSNGNFYDLEPNTTYCICTIAYDAKGNPGALQKTPIKTLDSYDDDNDAFVRFSEEMYGSGGFQFTCTRDGYCKSYHLVYGNISSADSGYPRVLYAFEINYYITHKKKHWFAEYYNLKIETNYPNNHTFNCYTSTMAKYPVLVAWAWGLFEDGSLSSDVRGFTFDTSLYNFSPNEVSTPQHVVSVESGVPSGNCTMIMRTEDNKIIVK